MLRNRSLQIKMVKDGDEIPESPSVDIERVIKKVTRSVVICTLVYIGADTLRRGAIYALSAKI